MTIRFCPSQNEVYKIIENFNNYDFYSIGKMVTYTGQKTSELKDFLKSQNINFTDNVESGAF